MEYLHANGLHELPGGLEVAAMYSFFLQGQLSPKERVKADPEVPRATTVTDDFGLRGQLQSEASNVEATATQTRNILLNLQKACNLPEYDDLLMKGKEYLHKKHEEANNLIALYLGPFIMILLQNVPLLITVCCTPILYAIRLSFFWTKYVPLYGSFSPIKEELHHFSEIMK